MKKIIIFHTINQFESYKEHNLPAHIIVFDIDLRLLLQDKKIVYKTPEHYMAVNEGIEVERISFNLANNWHKNLFKFNDISLGNLFSWYLRYYFAWVIQNIQLILNIIDIEKPSEIITAMDDNYFIQGFNAILNYICKIKKIRINFFPLFHADIEHYTSRSLIKSLIMKISTIQPVKKILKSISVLLMKFIDKKRNKILMVGSYKYPTLIEELSKDNIIFDLYEHRTRSFIRTIKRNLINIIKRKRICFYVCMDDYKTKKIRKQSLHVVKDLLSKWRNIINTREFKEQFVYKKIFFWDFIKDRINETIISDFKCAIESILILDDFLKKYNFSLITFDTDAVKFQKTLVSIASKLNIQTLVIQHGMEGFHEQLYPKIYINGTTPLFANKIAVWGKASKDRYIKSGVPKEKIFITGCPRFDIYAAINKDENLKRKIKNKVYKHFRIDKNKKLILYTADISATYAKFTTYSLNLLEIENSYKFILNTTKELPNVHLIIKLHPGDRNEYVSRKLIKRLEKKNISVVKKINIIDLLIACDCQVTIWSTSGLEGILLEKPLIYIGFNFRRGIYTSQYKGVAYEALNEEELLVAMKKCLKTPKLLQPYYKNFIEHYNYKTDGLATIRTIKLINRIMGHQNQ